MTMIAKVRGDLIVAASLLRPPEDGVHHPPHLGIVCAPITGDDARRLRLDPMVAAYDPSHHRLYGFDRLQAPMRYRHFADERASCCRALTNPMAAQRFLRGRPLFPLIARDGGCYCGRDITEARSTLQA